MTADPSPGKLIKRPLSGGGYYLKWVPERMPRIPDVWLESVAYVYMSREAADTGLGSAGSGFLLGRPAGRGRFRHVYAVTNAHVANYDGPVDKWLRVNSLKGPKPDTYDLPHRGWVFHPGLADVAVYPLGVFPDPYGSPPQHAWLRSEVLLTKEKMEELFVGHGDDVLMLGRFKDHAGRQRNTPTVRFGNIAMMPAESIMVNGVSQEAFLVEGRSFSEYSGSPVILDIPPHSYRPLPPVGEWGYFSSLPGDIKTGRYLGTRILGVNCGHFDTRRDVKDAGGNVTGQIKDNTGLMIVIPAWKVWDILDGEEMTAIRVRDEASIPEPEHTDGVTLD